MLISAARLPNKAHQQSKNPGRIDAEFLRLLFYHAHRESEEFFRLTGQLAQPNQDDVFSKRAAFFNGLKSKVATAPADVGPIAPWGERTWWERLRA